MYKLSICIPTYNRAALLQEAIESILEQLTDEMFHEVEIVVSDNCSNDHTEDIIYKLKNKYPKAKLLFYVNETNIGADRNFLKAVEISSGEYCWLLGSDDKCSKGAIQKIIDEIDLKHTIYISDRYNADCKNMLIFETQRFFSKELNRDFVFEFKDYKDWSFYIDRCRSLGGLFSYISSIVFNKKEWENLSEEKYSCFLGTAYVHVAILLQVLKNNKNATVKYLHDPIVINRTGNDSFMINRFQRTMLDFDGYLMLSELFEDNEFIKAAICYVVRHEYPIISWRIIVNATSEEFKQLVGKMRLVGYSNKEIEHLEMLRRYKYITFCMYAFFFLYKKSK